MPWRVRKRKNQWCVEKSDTGEVVPGGCHDTQGEANAQQRALYAGEQASVSASGSTVLDVKTVDKDTTMYVSWGAIPAHTAASVTITVGEDEPAEEVAASETKWEGILAFEGYETDDGRYFMPGKIDHRELPLSILAQFESAEGHDGAQIAARVDEIWWQESETIEGAIEIWGRGPFADNEAGRAAAKLVEEEFLTGISVDFAPSEVHLLDPETKEPIDAENMDLLDLLMGDFIRGFEGSILGATMVPFPAFDGSKISAVTASGQLRVIRDSLTASGAGMAPIAPPKEWFEMPEPDLPVPLTVADDGRVYGHIAVWGQCHMGNSQVCMMPPRSRTGYKHFHLGEITTSEGERVQVGRITVGEKGHAPISANGQGAVEHYDRTGCVTAFVTARDGKVGIWLSGAVRSDAPAEKVRDMMANPPSGDWRSIDGNLELRGVLAVPIPGYPIPRSEVRLVASGQVETVEALVAAGFGSAPMGPRAMLRRRGVLRARLAQALGTSRRELSKAEQRIAAMQRS